MTLKDNTRDSSVGKAIWYIPDSYISDINTDINFVLSIDFPAFTNSGWLQGFNWLLLEGWDDVMTTNGYNKSGHHFSIMQYVSIQDLSC